MEGEVNDIFIGILALLIICLPISLLFVMGIVEIIKEQRLKRNGIKTVGKVVKRIPASFKSQKYEYAYGTKDTVKTSGGYLCEVEYTDSAGDTYLFRTKKVFINVNRNELEVIYSEGDSTDVMVDGFYKVGNVKYFWIIGGLLGVAPAIAIVFLLIRLE
ncbi:hypothetical protein R9C00_17795 [Flammeovirgaceae bacterium SG7u.111]|nr:hypothetical protein [Flammeovirgaceae bacterium SG7u.132]WPO33557.1 hypothetical protein R9C00_17795 [Flammeovirgaceae bacterium SG7u.111]